MEVIVPFTVFYYLLYSSYEAFSVFHYCLLNLTSLRSSWKNFFHCVLNYSCNPTAPFMHFKRTEFLPINCQHIERSFPDGSFVPFLFRIISSPLNFWPHPYIWSISNPFIDSTRGRSLIFRNSHKRSVLNFSYSMEIMKLTYCSYHSYQKLIYLHLVLFNNGQAAQYSTL